MRGSSNICRGRILGWILSAALGVSASQAQFRSSDWGEDAAADSHWDAELERDQLLESILAERRELAHERLEDAASTIQSQASCPVPVGPDQSERAFQKKIASPFVARFAPSPVRLPWRGVAPEGESPSGLFSDYISAPVVQAKCINCHVADGISGHTRLVFSPSTVENHETLNLSVFETFLTDVEGGADLILNKIQGAESHGGSIQVVAGSTDFANMERFLRALGGETTSGALTVDTLFDGVTMATSERTLRRAALLFAGRLPTDAEFAAVSDGEDSSLRVAIRSLMTGPEFHDFLIRTANDRLLTDRDRTNVIGNAQVAFVNLTNKRYDLSKQAVDDGYELPRSSPLYRFHERAVQYGMARAPLELIARVVEEDLPYTEILTADYIMANPMAAHAYDADTEFDDPDDPTEFQPSEIAGYYRRHNSRKVEQDPVLGRRVVDPGNLSTDYPHAGILNTTVFLKRYPTTATNRNRARSRWTYYHFLGVDIEQSAARTTDPVALADTNNPTMHNPACTVCHIPMDPVAGTFQNFGDMGLYRDQYGGNDSLPRLYKSPEDGTVSPYQQGDTWFRDMRTPGFGGETAPSAENSLHWLAEKIVADERFAKAAVRFWWPAIMGVELVEPPTDSTDADFNALLVASSAQAQEVEELAASFREGFGDGDPFNAKDLLAEIALSPWFRAESVTGEDPAREVALRDAGVARLLTPEELAAKTNAVTGYMWGRRFTRPFGRSETRSKLHDPQSNTGYELLYGGIDSDGITERTGDMTPLMASVAQSHAAEVSCPIVRREFFYWPEDSRLLFDGITKFDTPYSESSGAFDVTAETWEARQTVRFEVALASGTKTVRLAFTNNRVTVPEGSTEDPGDRNLSLDRLEVRDSGGETVFELELETLGRQNCGRARGEFFKMSSNCALEIPVAVASDGMYQVLVEAHQDRAGDEDARLAISLEAEDGSSSGEQAIRRTLAGLHQRLFGLTVATHSADVNEAYDLFVEVWNRKRASEGANFFSNEDLHCTDSGDHLYFDGLAGAAFQYAQGGASYLNQDLVRAFKQANPTSDPHHTVRTWVVTLAYLLTDYRYLYF